MAFDEINQHLIDECSKNIIDMEAIKALIAGGADVNAFDAEYEEALYDAVLVYYIYEEQPNLLNLYAVTELFLANNLVLNPKTASDYFLPKRFRFLPPEKSCVDIFKMLLEKGSYSADDLEDTIADCILDLHLDLVDVQEQGEAIVKYYLELIYWACAYNVKIFPKTCSADLLCFEWFDRARNKIELISENRSTSVYVEDAVNRNRAEINGYTWKY